MQSKGAVMAHTPRAEALETSNCQCLRLCRSNVGSGAAWCILHFFLKQADEVREQAPYSYRQRHTDWFVYHQYLQMSIWAPLRKWIFQHEAECSEKSLVLAPPQTKQKYIYCETDAVATLEGPHVHLKIPTARQERQTEERFWTAQ